MPRIPAQKLNAPRRAALLAIVPLVAALPAFAQTVSPPAPPPVVPPSIVTSTPALSTVGAGGCVQQYNGAFSSLSQSALTASAFGLAAQSVGVIAAGVNLVAQEVANIADAASFTALTVSIGTMAGFGIISPGNAAGIPGTTAAALTMGVLAGSSTAKSVLRLAAITGNISDAGGLVSSIAGQVFDQDHDDLTDFVVGTGTGGLSPGLPFCELTFTGTVTVDAGGVNVTGASIFFNDVGFAADVEVAGNLTANQLHTSQGISAHGGSIFLGRLNATEFFDGITIGGGAIGGAGIGGLEAFTGDVTAIAIGNGASSALANGTAIGTGADTTGIGGTALGANSGASTGVAVGFNATTTTGVSIGNGAGLAGDAGVAVGTDARAREDSDAAFGNRAKVNAANGAAFGTDATISSLSDNGVAIGQSTTIGGVNAEGSDNVTAVGQNIDIVDGVDNAVALGTEANVAAGGGIAIGQASDANAADSIAIGRSVNTDGVRGVGIGLGANADGTDSVALGANSTAAFTNSAAFGNGATVTRDDQQKFGTVSNTYTMPGITSTASLATQSGLLEVPTTDAAGNLSTDGGAIFKGLARLQAGVAVAMAIESPELESGKKIAIRIGWGGFDSFDGSSNAVGASVIGLLGRNVFVSGDLLAFDGGVGWGWSEFFNYKENGIIAGRAGMTFSW